MGEHIVRVCATKLTLKFLHENHIFITNIINDCESCIYQIIKNQEIYPELLSNLRLFKLLDFHNQKYSFLFSFDLLPFPVSGNLLDSNERLLRWKNKSKKTLFFLSSLCLTKVLSFLSFSCLPKMYLL